MTEQFGFNLPGFTFLVPAHPGGPRHIPEEQQNGCVCVCVTEQFCLLQFRVLTV